jgi:hypothetical protein
LWDKQHENDDPKDEWDITHGVSINLFGFRLMILAMNLLSNYDSWGVSCNNVMQMAHSPSIG